MAERQLTRSVSPSEPKGSAAGCSCSLTAAASGCSYLPAWGETTARAAIWMFSPSFAVLSLLRETPKLRVLGCAVYPVPIDSRFLRGQLVPDTLRRRWLLPVGGIYRPQRLGR